MIGQATVPLADLDYDLLPSILALSQKLQKFS